MNDLFLESSVEHVFPLLCSAAWLLLCLHAANRPNQFLKAGAPFKAHNLFFTPCKWQTHVYCTKTSLQASTEERSAAQTCAHKHPHSCHFNLSPPRFSSPVVFPPFCLDKFSLSVFTSGRGLRAVPLAVAPGAHAQRRLQTPLPPRLYEAQGEGGGALCPVQLSPSVSLPSLFNTSCRRTSGEAVAVDTWLHKQWAPVRFIPHRHVWTACREEKKAGVFMFYRHWQKPRLSNSTEPLLHSSEFLVPMNIGLKLQTLALFCKLNSKTGKKKVSAELCLLCACWMCK